MPNVIKAMLLDPKVVMAEISYKMPNGGSVLFYKPLLPANRPLDYSYHDNSWV
jgi:hypothetical protein